MLRDWSGVVAYLGEAHQDFREFPGQRLRFTYAPGGEAFGGYAVGGWLALAIKIAAEARVRHRAAMVLNADLPVGGLAVMFDHVVLRQTLPLPALDAASLEATLAALAAAARSMTPAGPHGAMLLRP